ncbi:MAG: thiol:disulfide interchange protein [Epsilonproteobacteria bacterium]|nr:MAG: thiol:disulfide interchange protein [Campylobacterota bacterium]
MKRALGLLLLSLFIIGCNSGGDLKEQITQVIKENPEIVIGAIESKPVEFVEAFQKAAREAQKGIAKKRQDEEKQKLAAAYDKPLKPVIRKDEAIRGNKNGPIVIVEYSDFECPFCKRGFDTVMEVMKAYPGKVAFIYKHLPLSFHPQANNAAKYYEALRVQNPKYAWKFHDLIFDNQRKLKNGEKFLKAMAKKTGGNMKKLAKSLKDPKIQARIDADQKEAASFGMQGTPGFVVNGIPIKGAYPKDHFVKIINELKKRGKIKI